MKRKPRKELTAKLVEAATSNGKPQDDHTDGGCTGLVLRVTLAGKKTWTWWFTDPANPKKRVRMTLGEHSPIFGLKEARTAAANFRQEVKDGRNPTIVAPKAVVKTMAELIEDRMNMEVREHRHPKTGEVIRPALRTAKEVERRLKANVIKTVGTVPVKDFEISHLNMVLDPIRKRGALRVVGQVYTDLHTIFTFAKGRGEIKYNPIEDARVDLGNNVSERFLSIEEIERFWSLAPGVFIRCKKVETILKLCLLLGRRLNEVCGMRRSELNLPKREWLIPKDRMKGTNKKAKAFLCPLSDLAVALLKEAERSTNSEFLFPDDDGDGHYNTGVVAQILRRHNLTTEKFPLGRFNMPHFTSHDLRRTFGTQVLFKANKLGVSRFDKALVLNHTSVTKETVSDEHYDMNEYFEEKQIVIDKWGAFLAELVGETIKLEQAA